MDALMSTLYRGAGNLTYLRNYLLVVASLRALSVFLGYFYPHQLQDKVFRRAKGGQFTHLTARCFAVWTTVTCLLTVQTALNLHSRPLVEVCIASFVVANGFFATELIGYGTVVVPTITAPFLLATSSAIWLATVAWPLAK